MIHILHSLVHHMTLLICSMHLQLIHADRFGKCPYTAKTNRALNLAMLTH